MRSEVDRLRIMAFLEAFGRATRGPGNIFLTGGSTAVLHGFRRSTIDIDVAFLPEPLGAFEAIAELKERLDVNVELASPAHFLPELPGWRERCAHIGRFGAVDAFEYDFYAQVLSKIERNHPRDQVDVAAFLASGLIEAPQVWALFEAIRPQLVRFPAVDSVAFAARVELALGVVSR